MAKQPHGMSRYEQFVHICDMEGRTQPPLEQVFGRLGHRNPVTGDPYEQDRKALIAAFSDALDHMEDTSDSASDLSDTASAGMTFFGQFIDHDITLDATSALGTRIDPRSLRNVRTPALDLDCVYGDGPEASPHLYSPHPELKGFLLFGTKGNPRDLARNTHGTALIGDPRNDENQIVSQLQGAMVTLHNIVMTALHKDENMVPYALRGLSTQARQAIPDAAMARFEAARRIVRMHYQWIVANDFLPAFVDEGVLDTVRAKLAHGGLPHPFDEDAPVMPIEFSAAAYRFGHATVRNTYPLNTEHPDVHLFDMGKSKEFTNRPADRNLDFHLLFQYPGKPAPAMARKVQRKLAGSIYSLPFITEPVFEEEIGNHKDAVILSKKLPHRNILRDRLTFELNSGQQMARKMHGVKELAAPDELQKHHITKTPLWYYCLQEGEHAHGRLGPVGGTIVATVLLRLLHLDPESVICSGHNFKPWTSLGAEADGTFSLGHLLACVDQGRDHVMDAKKLITG